MQVRELGTGRQILGRRFGPAPYYRIAEQRPGRLLLESLPDANRAAGRTIILVGVAMLGVALLLLAGGVATAGMGGGIGPVALASVAGGVLGGLGARRLVGGRAIASTTNQIEVDTDAGTVVYLQRDRVGGERRQRLARGQVAGLRLRWRLVLSGGLIQRQRPLAVLELVLAEGEPWLVDSAAEPKGLAATAEALAEVLDVAVQVVQPSSTKPPRP